MLQPQGIANIAWSMASLGCWDAGMFHSIAQHLNHTNNNNVGGREASGVNSRLQAFDSQALCNLAWAFSCMGDGSVMGAVVQEAMHRVVRLGTQQMASLLASCAVLGHRDDR